MKIIHIFAFGLCAVLPVVAVAQIPETRAQIQLSFAPIVQKIAPAVVNIYTTRTVVRRAHPFMNDPFFRQFFGDADLFGPQGYRKEQVNGALGSGVILRADGLVVTNAHVVKSADEIRIVLADGREYPARVSLLDEPSDLALLRVEGSDLKLPHVSLRPSEDLQVGDLVLAIGNPFGVGQTVTSGIVSALARSSLNINDFNFFIQTDAAINPGNSGGPLVAMDGRVVGINTAIYSQTGGSMGLGFAIPSEMVESVIAAEKDDGKGVVVRPWLGIAGQRVTADVADSLGLDRPAGVLVQALHNASPLKKAGIQVGDIILRMNGHDLRDPSEMKFRMATVPIGKTADIQILRGDEKRDVQIKAIAAPDTPPRQQTMMDIGYLAGVTVANINPAVIAELDSLSQNETGVAVMDITPRAQIGRVLRKGDIILKFNGVDIKTVAHLKKASMLRIAGLSLTIERDGKQQQIMIR